jgi:hypothetical protein
MSGPDRRDANCITPQTPAPTARAAHHSLIDIRMVTSNLVGDVRGVVVAGCLSRAAL